MNSVTPMEHEMSNLMDLLRRNAPDAEVAAFRFKAVRPTFDLNPFRINGQPRTTARPSSCGRGTMKAGS